MSPRLRHRALLRILWIAAAAASIAIVMMIANHASGRSSSAAPAQAAPRMAAKRVAPKRIPLRPAVSHVVLQFVKTAVMRTHASRTTLLEGWRLAGPKLKEGTTLRQWLTGTSSVVPFPDGAIAPHLQIDRSSSKDALLELALYPTGASSVRAGVFMIGLHRYGAGDRARWLVDYWAPHGSSSMPAAAG
jgi:hypothetical protein